MQWTIPGTVLQADEQDAEHIEAIFQPMFLAGGMVLSQVASITGLEPYIAAAVPHSHYQYAQGRAPHGSHLRDAWLHQRYPQ